MWIRLGEVVKPVEVVESFPTLKLDLGYHYDARVAPLALTLQVTPLKTGHRLEGHFQYEATALCARCLRDVILSGEARFDLEYQPASQAPVDIEVEVSPRSTEIVYYDDDTLKLENLIIQQMYLEVPEKILCREDCQGLCSRCGSNLNDGPCACPPDADPRWGALSQFKHAQ